MRLTDQIIQKVPLLRSAKSFTQITKGFSYEEKWQVLSESGDILFLKIYDFERLDTAKSVYEHLEYFHQIGSLVPKPIQFIELPGDSICIQFVSSINGVDGEETLHKYSSDTQYKLGYQAGKELKKLHSLSDPLPLQTWEHYKLTKHNRYLDLLSESSIIFPEINDILHFIDQHIHLLKDRPVRFLHDDFHPSNIIFNDGELAAVIDFDRFEWGDPYHDFHKVALFTSEISKPFAIGQIDGYFTDNIPDEFWQYYTLYAAMIIPSDIIWSYKTTPHLIETMWKRVYRILVEHENFKNMIPSWYLNKSNHL
ncbi:aminoglycoside phosphotransferase family protein [Bacillus sp. JJ664]